MSVYPYVMEIPSDFSWFDSVVPLYLLRLRVKHILNKKVKKNYSQICVDMIDIKQLKSFI